MLMDFGTKNVLSLTIVQRISLTWQFEFLFEKKNNNIKKIFTDENHIIKTEFLLLLLLRINK